MSAIPQVGQEYDVPYGQGIGIVREVEYEAGGEWVRVRFEYASGCIPLPPPDRPDAPPDEWEVEVVIRWATRAEWEAWGTDTLAQET
ncbi:MAG: hypothetical protein OEZ06_00725 [Myxococcales bacterium]|nr:hypothetical protein [Myxococcales bacterium]